MAKASRAAKQRDQRSLTAARQGTAVSARLAVLRLLDRKPGGNQSPRRFWIRGSILVTVGLLVAKSDSIATQVQAYLSR